MSIVLFRVDERLIHGQVVVGWGAKLRPNRIIVVDDALADSVWEQELYTLGLPDELEPRFEPVGFARANLAAWRDEPIRSFVLTRDIATMRRLADGGLLRGEEVNLGGIHHADGRKSVLPYLYLSAEECRELSALAEQGVLVSARDVPSSRKVELPDLLKNSENR